MSHAPHQSESRAFRRLATLVLRHRLAFTALIIAITGSLAYATATRLLIDNSAELFMPDDDPSFRALEDLRDAFGRDQFFLVLVEGDVFSRPLPRAPARAARVDSRLLPGGGLAGRAAA